MAFVRTLRCCLLWLTTLMSPVQAMQATPLLCECAVHLEPTVEQLDRCRCSCCCLASKPSEVPGSHSEGRDMSRKETPGCACWCHAPQSQFPPSLPAHFVTDVPAAACEIIPGISVRLGSQRHHATSTGMTRKLSAQEVCATLCRFTV